MNITLKDGSVKVYDAPMTAADITKDISMGLYRAACCCRIDGQVRDLRTTVSDDCAFEVLTFDEEDGRRTFNHTASHIMAQAVKRLYPQVKLTIGPAIENGFYYDFDCGDTPFTTDDLVKIEAEMKKIVKENPEIERFELPPAEATALMEEKGEPYKVELIAEHAGKGEHISFYKQGEFTELCAGPHLMSIAAVKAFKLTNTTGAYWRGDAQNKMLCRVYGTAFPKASMLEAHLQMLEEAKKRDHRKLGKELELFTIMEEGPGFPFFLPKGMILKNQLIDYWRQIHTAAGYQEISTPIILSRKLWERSGHWDHYKENMYTTVIDDEDFAIKPMNCPGGILVYKNKMHSYKDLPIRIGEIAHDFRFEASGTLKGIERGRHFCQNDAHLFVTPEQIESEFSKVVDLIFNTYKDFGITDYRCVLSLRDPEDKVKYHDDDEMWNNAEDALRKVLNDLGIEYTEEIGEAAFYGPKLDVNVKPAVGNEYTLSTCQLDFCLPAKFNLTYVDKDGQKKTPVVLHRAILGSLDRFMAYILEETKGNLPLWLAPVQAMILPVKNDDEELNAYAHDLYGYLQHLIEVMYLRDGIVLMVI